VRFSETGVQELVKLFSRRFSRRDPLASACKLMNEVYFALAVRASIMPKDLMKPDGGLGEDIRMLPGVPGKIRLGLTGDETPVNGCDVQLFSEGEDGIEGAAAAARHIFRTDDGTVERLKGSYASLKLLRPAIVMEADDIALRKLDLRDRGFFSRVAPVTGPHATGERLRGMGRPSPGEGFGQQTRHELGLVLRLAEAVAVVIVRLVPDVPGKDAIIFGERGDYADYVFFKLRLIRRIRKFGCSGALNPAGVVNAGNGWVLGTEMRIGLPAGVEEHKDGTDMMASGDREEGIEAADEAFGVLLPELVLQKDPHGVHADGFGQTKLTVVERGIKGCRLKHLELINCVGRDVVCADDPWLAGVPCVGSIFGPTSRSGGLSGKSRRNQGYESKRDRINAHGVMIRELGGRDGESKSF